ncbi:MAG TPA: protein kinase [Egibacteraceae bacterium]|nr:protein kinase [Egibacteraceae bacterium]
MSEPVDQAETLVGQDADREGGSGSAGQREESAPARMLGGRYLLEEQIARGGMASVWRAHDEILARTVAVKLLHEHLSADDGFRERFRREAISAAKLTHPHVVGLYDTGTDEHRVYLVMEFIDGATLKDLIAEHAPLAPEHAAAIGERVARALDYAHSRGLVHRDVKPANILIGADGTVKVADFGIAKAEEEAARLTKTGMVLGTAAYVAPEQVTAGAVDAKADQYGLGIVLYECLTGRQPFKGDTAVATAVQRLEHDPMPVRSVRPDVPRGLDEIVARAMARDPNARFQSAGQMADALMAYADTDLGHGAGLLPGDEAAADATEFASAPSLQDDELAGFGDAESFLRSEGRWLAPVLALLALAGALVAIGLVTGILEPGENFRIVLAEDLRPRAPDPGDPEGPDGPAAPAPIQPAAIHAFDPLGDGQERDQDLPNLLDGDSETAWRTELYHRADFGGLKAGVGFWIDLGAPYRVDQVTLETTSPGFTYELRAAEAPGEAPDDWSTVAAEQQAGGGVLATTFDEPVVTQYVLVWITGGLQPHGDGRFKAELSQMTISGSPA